MSPEIATPYENSPQAFVEGSQPDTSPQLTQGETEKGGMVGPGQENIVEEFAREQEEAQQEEAILGKFKSPQELAKAYAELQRKMGEQGSQPDSSPDSEPEAAPVETEGYSTEQAVEVYGQEAVETLAGKGVDLADLMYRADSGEDISEHFGTLAETFGVSEQVVENYVSKAQAGEAAEAGGLTDADASALMDSVGGQEAFNQLSGWAKSNLSKEELANYNAVVDSGNKDAISWALKAMKALQGSNDAVVEPQLYGGGAPTDTTVRFESQQQVLDAMNKRNDRGQRMYDIDEAYRNKVQMILAASDVF